MAREFYVARIPVALITLALLLVTALAFAGARAADHAVLQGVGLMFAAFFRVAGISLSPPALSPGAFADDRYDGHRLCARDGAAGTMIGRAELSDL